MEHSWRTAIARAKPSAPARWAEARGYLIGRVLDYGCGRGADVEAFGLVAYDPHWAPLRPVGAFDTVLCTYVLNVVDASTQREILADIASLLKPKGVAWISVRRDIPRQGTDTQRWVVLPAPHSCGPGFAIYGLWREDLEAMV